MFRPVGNVILQAVVFRDFPAHVAGFPPTKTFAQGLAVTTISPKVVGAATLAVSVTFCTTTGAAFFGVAFFGLVFLHGPLALSFWLLPLLRFSGPE